MAAAVARAASTASTSARWFCRNDIAVHRCFGMPCIAMYPYVPKSRLRHCRSRSSSAAILTTRGFQNHHRPTRLPPPSSRQSTTSMPASRNAHKNASPQPTPFARSFSCTCSFGARNGPSSGRAFTLIGGFLPSRRNASGGRKKCTEKRGGPIVSSMPLQYG